MNIDISISEIVYNSLKFLAVIGVALAVTKLVGHFVGEESEEEDTNDSDDEKSVKK